MNDERSVAEPSVIPLYPGGAPESADWEHEEEWCDMQWSDHQVLRNVSQPTLTAFLPDPAIADGSAVVLAPGGAYHVLAFREEGLDVAGRLAARGVAAFVLKYRLIQTGDDYAREMQRNMQDRERMEKLMDALRPLILNDGQEAVRIVRNGADEWGIDAHRIGMLGYSAGGTVTLNVALRQDPECRPDFIGAVHTAGWDDLPVPEDAPPLFVICAADDGMAAPNSIRLYEMWRAAERKAELHIYSKGGHGFCLRKMGLPCDGWLDRFTDWAEGHGLIGKR